MDRIDREFMLEEYKRQNEERAQEIKSVGGLLDGKATKQLTEFLTQRCWLSPLKAADVVETIAGLAGQAGANPLQVIRDSLEGHMKPAFLGMTFNLREAETIIKGAIADVNKRIEESHKPAAVGVAASAAKPSAPKA